MTVPIKPRTHKSLDGTVIENKVENCAGIHQWQIDHIRQGLREANTGKFAAAEEVKRLIAHLRVR